MDRKIKKKKWTAQKIVIYCSSVLLLFFIVYNFIVSTGGSRLNVDREKINIATVKEGEFREFIPVDGNVYNEKQK
jgi:HlyD family secretion protein